MVTENKNQLENKSESRMGFIRLSLLLGIFVLLMGSASIQQSHAAVTSFERVSVGTGNLEGNDDSFFASLSEDGNIVAFHSFVSNWGSDQSGLNFTDIFVRDRAMDTTVKISVGPNGGVSDQRSFDPIVSADGRYVSFTSYATNLVSGDTNRHGDQDDGLDVFLYDRVTGNLQRVSVNWKGEQIDANSVGLITPDAKYLVFASNGEGIVENDRSSYGKSAIYMRNLATGVIERITKAPNGAFPDGNVLGAVASFDGRYVAYLSDSKNIVTDNNGFRDIMLYDRQTDQTQIISKSYLGGSANDASGPVHITPDGRFITFRSYASNLVPNDTNGQSDIFIYDTVLEKMELVSISTSGAQGNGVSKDPAVCGDGRFVSYTSEATNLVSVPHNGHRQVYVRDRVTETTFLATGTDTFMGNGRGHRSTLSADCSTIGFATEADNIIVGDNNDSRDLFVGGLQIPADLSMSSIALSGIFDPGFDVTYTFTLKNIGTETAVVEFDSPIPANTTYVVGSVAGASASYSGGDNAILWSGDVPGNSEIIISYAVTIDPALVDFTLITNQTDITFGANSNPLTTTFAVNGLKTYLPNVQR